MEKHSEYFELLYKCFNEMKVYIAGTPVSIDKYAKMFKSALEGINIQYKTKRDVIVDINEFRLIQRMITIITGNRNIPIDLRKQILNESLYFNELVEDVTKSNRLVISV